MSPFALETTGGHGASPATVYLLLAKQPRDSGLPADVLVVGKLNKDSSFALRRGTTAQVTITTHHALDGCAWLRPPSAPSSMSPPCPQRGGLGSPLLPLARRCCLDLSSTFSPLIALNSLSQLGRRGGGGGGCRGLCGQQGWQGCSSGCQGLSCGGGGCACGGGCGQCCVCESFSSAFSSCLLLLPN